MKPFFKKCVVLCFLSIFSVPHAWANDEFRGDGDPGCTQARKTSARGKWQRNKRARQREARKRECRESRSPIRRSWDRGDRRPRHSGRRYSDGDLIPIVRSVPRARAASVIPLCPTPRAHPIESQGTEKIQPNPARPQRLLIPDLITTYKPRKTIRYTDGRYGVFKGGEMESVKYFQNTAMCIQFRQFVVGTKKMHRNKLRLFVPNDGFSPLFAFYQMAKGMVGLGTVRGTGLDFPEGFEELLRRLFLDFSEFIQSRALTSYEGGVALKRAEGRFLQKKPISPELLQDIGIALKLYPGEPREALFRYGKQTYLSSICTESNHNPWGRAMGHFEPPPSMDLTEKGPRYPYQDVSLILPNPDLCVTYGWKLEEALSNVRSEVRRQKEEEGVASLQTLALLKILELSEKGQFPIGRSIPRGLIEAYIPKEVMTLKIESAQ